MNKKIILKDKRIKNQKRKTKDNFFLSSRKGSSFKKQIEGKLVSIEIQKEYDIFKRSWEDRIFVKLYIEARTSGLLRKISDRDWKTLCMLATFMDSEGRCYPSQRAIAKALGVSRQMANERIQSLVKFRFKEKPVLLIKKVRRSTQKGGRWDNNQYRILPISNLKVFSGPGKKGQTNTEEKPVSSFLDTGAMSRIPDTGKLDTNYNHTLNNNQLNNVNENAFYKKKKRTQQKELLSQDLAVRLGDNHSLGFYRRVVDRMPENLIYQTLSEVKDTFLMGRLRKSKGALFNKIIQDKAIKNSIDLGIKKRK